VSFEAQDRSGSITSAPENLGWLMVLSSVVIWGVNVVVLKAVLVRLPPVSVNVARLLTMIVCFALALVIARRRPKLTARDLIGLFVIGLFATSLYQALFLGGIERTPAGVASLVSATNPVWVAVFGAILGERMGRGRWFGIALSVIGVGLLALKAIDPKSGVNLLGVLMIVASSCAWAIWTIGSRRYTRLSTLEFTAIAVLLGAIPYVLLGFPSLSSPQAQSGSWVAWAAVIGSAFFSNFVAFLTWSSGVRAIGATRAASLINLSPIISVIVAALFLHEPVTWLLALSAAVTLCGVYLANAPSRR
jgi:drug/metabolite transporter (DMT)-like permease